MLLVHPNITIVGRDGNWRDVLFIRQTIALSPTMKSQCEDSDHDSER